MLEEKVKKNLSENKTKGKVTKTGEFSKIGELIQEFHCLVKSSFKKRKKKRKKGLKTIK